VALSLSKDRVFVVPGEGTCLLPIPWICLSFSRLQTYAKLAYIKGDPSVDVAQARSLQVQFLRKAPELRDILLNAEKLGDPEVQPRYLQVVRTLTASSARPPPNIFSEQWKTEGKISKAPKALTSAEIERDLSFIRTLGVSAAQLAVNREMGQIRQGTEDKFCFRPDSQTVRFTHTAPEKINPGVQSSRSHIVVKDFREMLHKKAKMPLEKKDMPSTWFRHIKNLSKCSGTTIKGPKQRDSILHQHCLGFMMRMTFHLCHLLNKVTDMSEGGTLTVCGSEQVDFEKCLNNFKLSRDLLSQFEGAYDEFHQKLTWAELSLFEKKVKVAEFYQRFSLFSSETPRIWSKGNFGIFMPPETAKLWTNYFSTLPRFQATQNPEPRAIFPGAKPPGNIPRKGVQGAGLTDTRNSRPNGGPRGRNNSNGKNGNRGRGRRGKRGKKKRKRDRKNQGAATSETSREPAPTKGTKQ